MVVSDKVLFCDPLLRLRGTVEDDLLEKAKYLVHNRDMFW